MKPEIYARIIDENDSIYQKQEGLNFSASELLDLACDSLDKRTSKQVKAQLEGQSLETSKAALQKGLDAFQFQKSCWDGMDKVQNERWALKFKIEALKKELNALQKKKELLLIAEERSQKEKYHWGWSSHAGICRLPVATIGNLWTENSRSQIVSASQSIRPNSS